MRRVAEIMHVVDSEREAFLEGALHPDEETQKVLWLCGVRKQQYFGLSDLFIMTFEYEGDNFKEDMARMSAFLEKKGHLVQKRRRDVPPSERGTTNWWAPVKKLGPSLFEEAPESLSGDMPAQQEYIAHLDGGMREGVSYDTSFDEDDWTESVRF